MKVNILGDNFSIDCYELAAGDRGLKFHGKSSTFTLPYTDINDFCVTKDRRDKAYFTMISSGKMYEGQVIDLETIDSFTSTLKERMGAVINIEVRK